jgi:aminoglycoside 2'-N-acetyltransferase I
MSEAPVSLQVAHTWELEPELLERARRLLYEVFGDEAAAEDWDHCLGGVHALILEGEAVIAHGAVVQRQLTHRGRVLRTGYVEGVVVRADRRRGGHGGEVMAALEAVIRRAYDLGALGASTDGARLYSARGWLRWTGRTWALTPQGLVRTPGEDGDIYVLSGTAELDRSSDLACDYRSGDLW